ncbi:MAG: LytR/AlgR family response regulator transcription factor [Cyclobacteriaceae bacterium]
MNVLLAEDETLAAERLVKMIGEYDPTIKIVAQPDSVSEVISILKTDKTIDLMFLDIQLADGKSFEIFDSILSDVPIIFITAYDQYALKAFKHHSIDYLLKPVQAEELHKAIDKFNRLKVKSALSEESIQSLKELIHKKTPEYKQRIVVKAGNKLQFRQAEEVAYFFADGKEAYMVTQKENRKHLIGYTLEELEQLLQPNDFFRISRKFIVRADAIAEVKGTMTTRLEVRLNYNTDQQLTVSRERVSDFKKWLDR